MHRLIAAALLLLVGYQAVWAEDVYPGKEWESATPASQGVNAEKLAKAKDWLAAHNSKSGLVVRHGRVIAEWYFDGADATSKFAAYSTSKSLSSMATGLAIADGKLALDTTVGRYFPEAMPKEKQTVNVKQLLSMTTGVHNDPNIIMRDDLFSYALNKVAMDHEPGTKWDYNNTGLALLSPVFHKATGQQIDEFLSERLFQPIGMTTEDWTWEHREGYAIPYSGCHTTARSLARIGLLVLRNGKWNDKQVVPAKWLAESIVPSQHLNASYGYLWWNNTTGKWPNVPKDAYAALGRWDNDILVVPSLDLVVIRQSDVAPTAKDHNIGDYLQAVCDAVKKE